MLLLELRLEPVLWDWRLKPGDSEDGPDPPELESGAGGGGADTLDTELCPGPGPMLICSENISSLNMN